ncbi:MAG: FkbM family methyltransferase [Symploca sp. SIO3C6]|uniref:FkbM family methyltransferase n=1 Tax=Symploca sp. SIO1C4 TaxID=2607765 RepID=A0A6B3NI12_9CYAN|nr:FkbM family methyltransferase [Symploca sp. SIO3C6]NER30495.1 FkbM family methyltransferase [Symploca sp. SIO1C4]NET06632.1 FkbM family methyltransferase [Symploca sp. SIO2B6]
MKKLLRTLQVNFPYLLNKKFTLMRFFRNRLEIPFEEDFHALSFFPDVEGALFLDVGANRGQSTDAILMKRKNIRIYLFEPNELLCENLKNLFCNNEKIFINNFGLGDETVEQFLFVPFYKKWMFDGLASFDEQKARNWLKGKLFFYRDQFLTVHKVISQIRRLDELNLDPFLIKLDLQGYEYNALKGGEQTIIKYEPVLLIESPEQIIINYLKAFGYQLYAFREGKFIPGIKGKINTFFMTQQKWSLLKNAT